MYILCDSIAKALRIRSSTNRNNNTCNENKNKQVDKKVFSYIEIRLNRNNFEQSINSRCVWRAN